ncbi:MAG: glycosyltransferase [Chloroflexota bacterium]
MAVSGEGVAGREPPRRRALILAAEYPPVGGGGVIRIAKLVKYLPEFGWDLTVICSDEPSPPMTDPDLLADVEGKGTVVKVRGPLRAVGAAAGPVKRAAGQGGRGRAVVRLLKSAVNTLAFPDRWIGWAWKASRLAATDYGNPDVVIATGPPFSAWVAARWIAHRLGVPYVLDVRDDWAGNPRFSTRAPLRDRLVRRVERRLMAGAALVAVISEASKAAHLRRHPGFGPRLAIIPNGFDPEDFEGVPQGSLERDPDELDFLFAGSIHGFDARPALEAFGTWVRGVKSGPRPVLTILGEVLPDQAAAAEAAIPAANLRLESSVPHRAAIERMQQADVLVLLLREVEVPEMLTGKLFEYVAARRPILAISGPCAATELITRLGVGGAVDPKGNADDTLTRVVSLARDPAFRGAPEGEIALFDRRAQAALLSDRLEAMLSP